ncbi:E3 ubiquitin-protein ligase MARCH-like [Vairimorpha necatrix]|uniref:E3 ubiquitin-protein ligase MARCH-like n=1 Tax=Vairimorpha necatrix TaxID=6039 RepID=A0AAX4J9D6_9MICR
MNKIEATCKICYSLDDTILKNNELIAPCNCKGSLKYVHRNCLKMWRFKSKYYNIKKCLQCGMYYNIKDEVYPNSLIIFSLTILILFTIHLLISLVLRFSIKKTYLKMDSDWSDIFYLDSNHVSFYNIPLHITTLFIYILMFKLVFYCNFLSIFNFVFTYWRITQLDFFIDKFLYIGLCVYYFKHIYNTLYNRLEHLYISTKEKQN